MSSPPDAAPHDDGYSSDDEFGDTAPVQVNVEDSSKGGPLSIGGHMAAEEEKLLGDACSIIFQLPDGSTIDATFRMGQTIEVMKMFLEDNHNLPYSDVSLYLDGALLFDPLSLSDTKLSASEPNIVEVRQGS